MCVVQHLLTFLELRQPGWFMRSCVFATQGIFFNFFWMAYLISPRFCHRLVGRITFEAWRAGQQQPLRALLA